MTHHNTNPQGILGAVAAALVCVSANATGPLNPTNFTRAVSFTVSGYDGASTLENFPVLVRLSEGIDGFSYADIGTTTNAAYASLRFADAAEDNLDYEIETWDPDGTSFVWVSLPSLSGTETEFRAYYKPAAGAPLPDIHPTNVWTSAGYVGVWHLNDIIRNYSGSYKAYNDHLWGHVFPDSTGSGANATKGTTSWNTQLFNVPNDTGGYHFPESNGRANGTLGANAYTPFIIPRTSEGGGAGDWSFSGTGYSTEAWIFPFGKDHAFFIAGQTTDASSDNFTRASTNLVRIAANDWGQSSSGWNANETSERIWHFVTTVWTPTSSADPTRLYGTSEDGAPTLLQERNCHATDQFATEGMRFTAGTGQEHGVDEMRVRRGLSTPDWIQANWDTQRVGTDFLKVGFVHDPHVPIISNITRSGATATIDYSFAGIGDSAKALFVNFATKVTNEVVVADLANPSATATNLDADADYDVKFVVKQAGAVVFETSVASFTTAGRQTLDPRGYHYSVMFTASGYDGAETLEHFPVLVHLSETNVTGFSYWNVDPSAIRFTAADGSLLAHEIETWDPTGLSTIWVGLPSLSGTDTTFTMHWRPIADSGVSAQPIYRVWHYAGYECVWHLNERLGNDETRYKNWDELPFALYYADSSGNGRHATKGTTSWTTTLAMLSPTNGPPPVSANGSLALETAIPLIVPPTVSGGMDFSASGYSSEAWFNPERGGSLGLFMTGNGVVNSTNSIFADNKTVGALSLSWNMKLRKDGGNSRVSYTGVSGYAGTNVWHFLTANWAPAGAETPTAVYAGNPTVPAALRGSNYSDTAVAQDISATGIGLTGSVGASSGGTYGNFIDELRIRRGRSSADWIQANWDTQRLGTDFLEVGDIVHRQYPTMLILR